MEKFTAVYLPVGVGTFDMESARAQFGASCEMLRAIDAEVICPDKILLSPAEVSAFLEPLSPDLVILQNATFANAAYAGEAAAKTDCPLLLWTLREPPADGGRLRLNSMTGAFSAAHMLRRSGRKPFAYVYGSAAEAADGIRAAFRAARTRFALKHLKLAQIGHTPQGFGFGRAADEDMLRYFGVHLESAETRQLMARAAAYSADDIAWELETAHGRIHGLDRISEKNRTDFARLWKAYRTYVEEEGIGAVSSRCWPDFFTDYGTPVCAVLAMLNDSGVAAGCEADAYGALSMFIGMRLSGGPVFFGDPVSIDEAQNTFTFWHCGTAACSLAREDTGACAGVHCNRKIGPTLDFGCKAAKEATVLRVGQGPEGAFRLFALKGEILDAPKQYTGTSAVVRVEGNVRSILERSVKDGWEPHFVVAYGDITKELEMLAEMLRLAYCRYP
ncbi:MAG: fucose isomerase [Eubacteriales bacterium]|nr:fucose isomerase [Eubacteriales bacterium]